MKSLEEEASCSPDWAYGETLIHDSYFEDYAQELTEDCGMISENKHWPNNCIDWKKAADECTVTETQDNAEGIEYCWGWWDNKDEKFTMVWPSRVQLEVCFPYGYKIEEKRGKGHFLRVYVCLDKEVR